MKFREIGCSARVDVETVMCVGPKFLPIALKRPCRFLLEHYFTRYNGACQSIVDFACVVVAHLWWQFDGIQLQSQKVVGAAAVNVFYNATLNIGANGKHFAETGNWLPRFTRDLAAGPVVVVVANADSEIEINI